MNVFKSYFPRNPAGRTDILDRSPLPLRGIGLAVVLIVFLALATSAMS